MNPLLYVFLAFVKIGLFAVGGGLATIPFLTELMRQRPQWFTAPTLPDIVAIAESTPGPIGINAATFVGYSAAGIPGAVIASLALALPSLVIVSLIARYLNKYRSSPLVENAFSGLRPAVAGLIAASALTLLQAAVLAGPLSAGLFAALRPANLVLLAVLLFVLLWERTKRLHPILFILFGAAAGILFSL